MSSHFNRSRYEVVLGDGWQRFVDRLPSSIMLGVIRVGDVEGALVRHVSTNDYLLVRPGRVITLLARKVEAAIAAAEEADLSRFVLRAARNTLRRSEWDE